ncbi:AtpZ/AtpI family protein [Paenibacillus sp. HW567]|uniref:AtpZ/AtpI family protein n=1 Tax=Paenibacillus sp. HW567 TaxID=1034769 RepID=UPI000382E847|nr:AtpZ/AtpI family protein [Paenibacillus sp. HW567]
MKGPDKPQEPHKQTGRALKAMSLVSAVGINLAAFTLGGYFLGAWLDSKWNNSGLGVALGVILGVLCGIAGVIFIIKAVMEESDG